MNYYILALIVLSLVIIALLFFYRKPKKELIEKPIEIKKVDNKNVFPAMKPNEILTTLDSIIDFYIEDRYLSDLKLKEVDRVIVNGKIVMDRRKNKYVPKNEEIGKFSESLSIDIYDKYLSESLIYEIEKVLKDDSVITYIYTRIFLTIEKNYISTFNK